MKFKAVPAATLTLILSAAVIVSMISGGFAWGEFLKKQFIICKDQGRDVLCDPVVVQKNDFVIRLFKQKGEIAHSDFPLFLGIFQRLNPEVKDIDLIYPGQRVIVPLKIIEPGTLEGQASGTVSIPFIAITNIPAQIQKNSTGYVVLQGDSVSSIVSRLIDHRTARTYKEALALFQYLNPQVKDLNRIQAGQTLQLPTRQVMDASWYPELFDRSGNLVVRNEKPAAIREPVREFQPVPVPITVKAPVKTQVEIPQPSKPVPVPLASPGTAPPSPGILPFKIARPPARLEPKPFVPKPVAITPLAVKTPLSKAVMPAAKPAAAPEKETLPEEKPKAPAGENPRPAVQEPLPSIFRKAAGVFSAQLLDSGEYFFPRSGAEDLRVDLSATPVMEFPSGFRLLFAKQNAIPPSDQKVITAFWKQARIVTLSYDAPLRELLSAVCRAVDPVGCENQTAFNDNGVRVSVRGDYIFDAVGASGKTCVTLIDGHQQCLSDAIRRYLLEKQIIISEWIDSESYFGPLTGGGKAMTRPLPTLSLSFDPARPSGFVRDFSAALGLRYQEKVEITFPYAGFQVKAYANLLSAGRGREILVDFGDIQGDAIKSIEATGFQVLQIRSAADAESVISALLSRLPARQQANPVFWAAERSESRNTSLQVPGSLISLTTDQGVRLLLLTDVRLNDHLLAFLAESGIQVARMVN